MSCPHCPPPKPAPEPPKPAAATAKPASEPPKSASAIGSPEPPKSRQPWRILRKKSWTIPSLLLLIMPKCPVCLAAYIAMGTGIGIPLAAAAWLRGSLIVLCVGWLILYLYRR